MPSGSHRDGNHSGSSTGSHSSASHSGGTNSSTSHRISTSDRVSDRSQTNKSQKIRPHFLEQEEWERQQNQEPMSRGQIVFGIVFGVIVLLVLAIMVAKNLLS